MLADIAEPSRSEQGICTGMGDDISIAMASQSLVTFKDNPSKHQGTLRVLYEWMDIETLPNSYLH